jgi:hypothetical protein
LQPERTNQAAPSQLEWDMMQRYSRVHV